MEAIYHFLSRQWCFIGWAVESSLVYPVSRNTDRVNVGGLSENLDFVHDQVGDGVNPDTLEIWTVHNGPVVWFDD